MESSPRRHLSALSETPVTRNQVAGSDFLSMTFGSLFAGIGGLDLGLERAGMECRWQVEIDDYATRVLERHWPDVQRWRDIHDFIGDAGAGALSETQSRLAVDLVCGGFPCVSVSVAGDRRGSDDHRWLWPQFRTTIGLLRPSYVVVENVPGLLTTNDGREFRGILRDLSALGYDAEWHCLPAGAFGLPHLRWRVFVVAYRAGDGWNEGQSESARSERGPDAAECGRTTAPQWRTIEPTVRRGADVVSNRVDRLRCLGNAVCPDVAEWIGNRIMESQPETASLRSF